MSEKYTERKVGAFILISLLVIGILILSFGDFDRFVRKTYTLHAEFANASGIIRNAQVLYRGAKVGVVAAPPEIADQGDMVKLELRINKSIRIPNTAEFKINVRGLLGDMFVDIVPPKEMPEGQEPVYLKDGDVVKGAMNQGLAEFLAQAEQKLQKFDMMITDIKTKIITDEFITDFHESVANARQLLERSNRFLASAEQGKGPLYVMMKDQQTATDIKQFIYNLRKTGPFFYSDLTGKEDDEDDKKAKPANRRR